MMMINCVNSVYIFINLLVHLYCFEKGKNGNLFTSQYKNENEFSFENESSTSIAKMSKFLENQRFRRRLLNTNIIVKSFNTTITIKNNDCNGYVTQNILYEFKGDKFASIIQKVSLESSSDSAIDFKISSKYIFPFNINHYLIFC